MTHVLDSLLSLSGVPVYAVVGSLAFMEAALFVGLVLPGETALFLGGVLAGQGRVSLVVLLAVAVLAAVAGDSVGYEVGRRGGPALKASRLGRMVGEQRWARGEDHLARRGGSAVLLGRWVGVLRALVPAVAGMSRMPYRRFLAYNAAGGTLWPVTVVLLGYFAGASFRKVEAYLGRASLLLLVVLVAVATVVAVARYLARHPDRVAAAGRRVRSAAAVRWTEGVAASVLARVSRRAGAVPAFSLGVVAALVAAAVLAMGFAEVLDNVLDGNGVALLDRPVLEWLAAHRDDEVTVAMQALTAVGGPVLLPLLALAGAGVLRWRTGSWAPAGLVVLTAAGSGAITLAGKHLVGRARPAMELAVAGEGGFSFPSGHSLNSLAIIGVLAVLAARATLSWSRRVWIGAGTGVLVALIGLSRLYLGVHWLTDVLAAWLVGGVWLIAVLGLWRYSGMRDRVRGEMPDRVHGEMREA
ncbi:bifunctional DedA family/phosphatase PAP2 family protein [Georgenia muralis]|uniref:Undecaprenyl-diphosphatase n=1 Tax=Georgenia muralis TaxID=154117 RepID=A0A3N5A3T9_9MICO|nr:bifunctional DedA family/phosphatase PAP2 family protein [Georgenia muralis]RPF28025.1 undecaprenyl-diphosphatase [Georgenia muralis]